ncbi:regulatory iron-sulfur-containing complex subunit RicT [uncultured Flavobacterium sp.]|uniref:regulatory iron-sulfur-containing complex subunit RicT n=1 Tax=uncultured Flavobacterium sp. TaxID=165435 RepID=UPI0025FBCE77|nr:regulatory iron-sulfur-containing complex subunit RicT [uncultured Flavobacterium sp.]
MACTNCSTGSKDGTPRGCKNNGTCGTDSCNKLTVFDWLSNMSLPGGQAPFDAVEVRFKNGRKEFYRNTEKLTLGIGDIVATEASPGHDIGIVTLTGELVKVQMKKKNEKPHGELPKVYRKASQKDIDIWSAARDKEEPMKVTARELAIKLKLEMKISDIEFQGDGSKATFYYTANDRVDFRQLIKDYARVFSIRIEMKQVGFRQEASRLGGIGSCGRELCCSTWLTDFRSVNTSAARYQQLSLNPQKLAGQCGKLKCCLNYELDTYLDALKGLPDMDTKLYTEKGDAICQKVDIFKGLMWFAYTDNMAHWHVLAAESVKEMLAINKQKERVSSLEDYAEEVEAIEPEKTFQNAMGQDSLTRFDAPKRKNRKKPGGNKGRDKAPVAADGPRDKKPQDKPRNNNRPNRDQQSQGPKPQNAERQQRQKPEGNTTGPKPESTGQNPNANRNKDKNRNRNKNRNRPPRDNNNNAGNADNKN